MTSDQLRISKNIVGGLNYLMLEAETNGIPRIAKILKICVRDVCLTIENAAEKEGEGPGAYGADLFIAIKFLGRFASIKDEVLKKEIMVEIEKIKDLIPPVANDAS